ncbi:hypothetical protein F5I97DRAFT_1808055, partial [Phlebopus sp. FC_14]
YFIALVHWFNHIADAPDELTGMWMVASFFLDNGSHNFTVIHIDSIVRSIHLLPIFDKETVSQFINCDNSLDLYQAFYVNRFVDHHAYEIVS